MKNKNQKFGEQVPTQFNWLAPEEQRKIAQKLEQAGGRGQPSADSRQPTADSHS